jgi:single-strand DNA-binding protein
MEGDCMAERSVNKAILVGRLGADAETKYTPSGTPVSRMSLAMNRQWTDNEKQVHEDTDWMQVVIWKRENLAAYLTKGTRLYVEGRLQTRSYDDKDGVKRYVTEVIAQNIVLLGGNGNGHSQRGEGEQRSASGKPSGSQRDHEPEPEDQGITDDDVPF